MIRIVPALIPADSAAVKTYAHTLAGIPELHLDVVDGQFVSHTSWPYRDDQSDAGVVREVLAPFTLEVDLMVTEPLAAAADWIDAGADLLVFHVETISVPAFKHFAETHTVTVGVAANNDTPDSVLAEYVPYADYVQVMGIATIGSQGQPFDERALDRIVWLNAAFPQLSLSIDGSMNKATLPHVAALPLQRCIVGSAIIGAPDPRQAYTELQTLVSHRSESDQG